MSKAAPAAISGKEETFRSDYRNSGSHGLGHGESKAFIERRVGEDGRSGSEAGKIFFRHVAQITDEWARGVQPRQGGFAGPTLRAGDDEIVLLPDGGGKRFVGVEKPRQILPRFDGADEKNVSLAAVGSADGR